MGTFQKQLIIYPNINLSSLNISSDIYDGGKLSFFIDNTNYQVIKEGNATVLTTTANGSYLNSSKFRKGFTCKLIYPNYNLWVAISLIASEAILTKIPIVIDDYLSIEPEDYLAGVTIRKGFFVTPIEKGGAVKDSLTGIEYLPDSFSITFMESKLRYF